MGFSAALQYPPRALLHLSIAQHKTGTKPLGFNPGGSTKSSIKKRRGTGFYPSPFGARGNHRLFAVQLLARYATSMFALGVKYCYTG